MVLAPNIEWREFNPSIDPSGHRVESLSIDQWGFQGVKNTSDGGTLIFGSLNTSISGQISDTKVVTAHVTNWGDSSGLTNMKTYLSSISAFDNGTYRFLYAIHRNFWTQSGVALSEIDSDFPTAIPASQNILSTLGSGFLKNTAGVATPDENQVTEYLYLAVFANTDMLPGTYGGPGGGGFRVRLLYDFS